MQVEHSGVAVNRGTIRAYIVAVICSEGCSEKLKEHGGGLGVSTSWIGGILKEMNLSYRKATSTAQKLPVNYEEVKRLFILRYSKHAFD